MSHAISTKEGVHTYEEQSTFSNEPFNTICSAFINISHVISAKDLAEIHEEESKFGKEPAYMLETISTKKRVDSYEATSSLSSLDYGRIQTKENKRRTVMKDAQMLSGLEAIFRFRNTVLALVVVDIRFWFALGLYFVTRWFESSSPGKKIPFIPIPLAVIGAIGAIISFSLVFYLSQSYSRYTDQYHVSMSIEGRVFDIVLLCRSSMSNAQAWRVYRYANLAHLLCYVGLSDIYNEDNFFIPINKTWRLLSDSEFERLHTLDVDSGGSAYREVIAWLVKLVNDEFKLGKISPREFQLITEQVLGLRARISVLYHYADQPVPFLYTQFVLFMSSMYMPLFAYATASNIRILDRIGPIEIVNEIAGALLVMMNCMFVLGLLGLSHKLQDPYGKDIEDLCVFHYVTFVLKASLKVMKARPLDAVDPRFEDELDSERPSAGPGF